MTDYAGRAEAVLMAANKEVDPEHRIFLLQRAQVLALLAIAQQISYLTSE